VRKQDRWRDEHVAAQYEARRFAAPLARWKHRHDVALVCRLLTRVTGAELVLDLPTGTGRLLPGLRAAGKRALGADLALEMLRAGQGLREGDAPLVQADAAHLPFRDGAVDAVVSLRFLFHLTPEERRPVYAEMRRVGGVVIGEVRYRWTLKHAGRWLRSRVGLSRRYEPSAGRREIAEELAAAGLELTELWPVSRVFSDKALFLARRAR
jgi:SAM-dependent methyltransferase